MPNFRLLTGFLLIFICLTSGVAFSNSNLKKNKTAQTDSVQIGIDFLKRLLDGNEGWGPKNSELEKDLRGLVHFIEDEKIDTILSGLNNYNQLESQYFSRLYTDVPDSLNVSGYVSYLEMKEQFGRVDREVRHAIVRQEIPVPERLFENINQKVRLLQKNEAHLLLENSLVVLPDSLLSFKTIPDSSMISKEDYERFLRLDSLKNDILEKARKTYNNNMLEYYMDSVSNAYRDEYINQVSLQEQEKFAEEVQQNNQIRLQQYNDSVTSLVNSQLSAVLDVLIKRAEIVPADLWIYNLDGDSTQMRLRKYDRHSKRVFIKNEQKDSLGIRIQNIDKDAIKILIDDGVTFTRFAEKQKKDFKFQEQLIPEKDLRKVKQLYTVSTPWILEGDGNFGFSQTYLSNWKKGGQSALSTLLILKGSADYSVDKVKWENDIEIRNGWLKPGGEKIQKNDDKFSFTSRFGISAFKKWYYSAELDFETQFFYGYKYPDRDNPISGFLAPSRTLLKFGLDYKPNKNFSLFLSPFTSKTIYVRDTAKIDAGTYGIEPGKKRYWEPGLNADLSYKIQIMENISYSTKYKMFINYKAPFTKFDIDWENNFSMQLNNYITMRFTLHFIYDDNVKFPIYEEQNGEQVKIGEKAKWQTKEFISVGFAYKLNKRIYRRERIN